MSGAVLALDSCGAETTLALLRDEAGAAHVLRERTLPAKTAGSQLTVAMREVLGETAPAALRAIVVVRGPGSFTGMRIGLSAVKALAEATGVPLVAVSRLAVLAQGGAAALDAGRGRVYLSLDGAERLRDADEAIAELAGATVTVCEPRVASRLPAVCEVPQPTAADAARHAWPRVLAGEWDDVALLDAHYLWRAEEMLRGGA